MADRPIPTTASIRNAYALWQVNTHDDLAKLSTQECQDLMDSHLRGFDLWAEQNGVEIVLDPIIVEPAEVRESE